MCKDKFQVCPDASEFSALQQATKILGVYFLYFPNW